MTGEDEMLDVSGAAALTGRHPETIRRWVWSGRLVARRQGRRLLVSRGAVTALAGADQRSAVDLAEWAERARRAHDAQTHTASRPTAADLVLEDRAQRSQLHDPADRSS